MKKIAMLVLACWLPLAGEAAAEKAAPAPAWLVEAIIRHESGQNPYAVNIAGKSYFPATQEEALRLIRQAVQSGKSFDVGLMQINRYWIEKFSIPPSELLDPVINTSWGRKILAWEIERHGLNWLAVGKYHSPDIERGRRYAWRIYNSASKNDIKEQTRESAYGTADKKTVRSDNLPDSGGVRRSAGQRQPGRIITFQVPETGQPVKSLEHQQERMELRRLKGEIGSIGGLLKQAIAGGADKAQIGIILRNLDTCQLAIQDAIKRILP